ncbi:MAG: tetratricopeptide repeat protein [Acidobacteria bacterium]|nr:tetratricopeptide repeat protein [Acidobacteriota bacterium]
MFDPHRLAAALAALSVLLAGAAPLQAQSAAPRLNKSQRTLLEAVVAAVDRAAAGAPETPLADATWLSHVLRASDGSHYVALRAEIPDASSPKEPATLYVRLALRRVGSETLLAPPRSAVMDWLQGLRGDPLPMRAMTSMSVPQGEIPVGGAAMLAGSQAMVAANDASNALRLQDMERERARREREAREKQRRAELESRATTPASTMHAFEDFDVKSALASTARGLLIDRGVTAGPGDYDVFIGWAEPSNAKAPAVRVISHHLSLPAANRTDFSLSDVVLADAVRTLESAYPVEQQGAHPYAIGALETTPARDTRFRVDELLSVVVQVINPAGGPTGKPEVDVAFRVSRDVAGRPQLVGSLPVQHYTASTLPVDFDVASGHPLFAALQMPLATFARGRYTIEVIATDRVGGRQTTRTAAFEVTGTPESLLREAPTPGQAFRRDSVLAPVMLTALGRALAPPSPSEPLARSLAAVATGRFAELVRVDTTIAAERPIAQALLGIGLYGLGDSARSVAAQLTQAASLGAPSAPVLLMLGATYALGGDDKAAVAAWNQAREGGIDDDVVATLLIDAYMRQGDVARAAAMATAALDSQPGNAAARRALAATYIATRRPADALRLLDAAPADAAEPEHDFLVMHALFAGVVAGDPAMTAPAARERFVAICARYMHAAGRHADLVREWLAAAAAAGPR